MLFVVSFEGSCWRRHDDACGCRDVYKRTQIFDTRAKAVKYAVCHELECNQGFSPVVRIRDGQHTVNAYWRVGEMARTLADDATDAECERVEVLLHTLRDAFSKVCRSSADEVRYACHGVAREMPIKAVAPNPAPDWSRVATPALEYESEEEAHDSDASLSLSETKVLRRHRAKRSAKRNAKRRKT